MYDPVLLRHGSLWSPCRLRIAFVCFPHGFHISHTWLALYGHELDYLRAAIMGMVIWCDCFSEGFLVKIVLWYYVFCFLSFVVLIGMLSFVGLFEVK